MSQLFIALGFFFIAIVIAFDLNIIWTCRAFSFCWLPRFRKTGNQWSMYWLWWFIQPQFWRSRQ